MLKVVIFAKTPCMVFLPFFHEGGKKKCKFKFCRPKKTTFWTTCTMYKMLKAPPFFKSQNFFGTSLNNNNDNKSEHAHRMILKS